MKTDASRISIIVCDLLSLPLFLHLSLSRGIAITKVKVKLCFFSVLVRFVIIFCARTAEHFICKATVRECA